MRNGRLSRREMLKAMSLAAAGSTALPGFLTGCRQAGLSDQALEQAGLRRDALDGKPRFLIVISAAGGASIVDSFLAVRASESNNAAKVNTFPDAQVQSVAGSPFRAVKVNASALGSIPVPVNTDQLSFVQKHAGEMLVATTVSTSVNHVIAQKRSLTGNNTWKGRTLQECVALQYGASFPIPNVNMGISGYAERGVDDLLPAYCYGELVQNPSLWPLGLDGSRGLKYAPTNASLDLARATRQQLDAQSIFGRTFADSKALTRWNEQRTGSQAQLQTLDLITRLNLLPNMPPQVPLTEYGLGTSPDAAQVTQVFPDFFTDPVQGQAALAFLLLKYRVSCSVTLGPGFNVVVGGANGLANPPLAFDFSHNDHRAAQAFMWARILGSLDKLIGLLKSEPFDATQSLWDRTLIYVATDFGRTRTRPDNAETFGSGHDLNNGVLMLSPMLKGNTVLGGVDPNTALTYGFDARTGRAQPGKMTSNEADIFSGVLQTLAVDTSGSGLPDASAFVKG